MLQKLRERSGSESGFTLVELLVVMLILGILAAIAIPSFFNQRDKAKDADSKADVRTAQTAMETLATDNDGSYASATNAKLVAIEPTLSDVAPATGTARMSLSALGTSTYKITVASENTPNTFSIERTGSGNTILSCATIGTDGCPTSGFWD